MKINWKEHKYALAAQVLFAAILFALAFLNDGTGDEGDSIGHYLFARYAPIHPENFFNHWGKPFFTLLASPFAQFGFMGIKIFNCILSCIAIWFTYLIAVEMKYKWAIAVFIIALFFKTFLVVTLSGLTEPLCNAMIAIAIYLAFTQRYVWAAVIMSFLPFVRSEGLFLCGTFSLYLLLMRQWRVIPLLLLGHLVYSIAGYPYHHDLLWVFSKIPYARIDKIYGHGSWTYFGREMPVIAGVINSILLALGMLGSFFISFYFFAKKRYDSINTKALFLAALFAIFFLMHTAFWALGLFGSFGMIRVFIAIASVMILVITAAIEYIDNIVSKRMPYSKAFVVVTFFSLSIPFSFGSSHYAFNRQLDFGLHPDQIRDTQLASLVKETYPDYRDFRFFLDAAYMAYLLHVDIFDSSNFSCNNQIDFTKPYPPKSIVIWDDWYSCFEKQVPLQSLKNNKSLRAIKTFTVTNREGKPRTSVLFVSEK